MSAHSKPKIARTQPIGEVFGFTPGDTSAPAKTHRQELICPYNNVSRLCTKDKKANPLGVCTLLHENWPVTICPIRFRENWTIARDAARFCFGPEEAYTILSEIKLYDAKRQNVGKFDFVLVTHRPDGQITDYGILEVQSVYISGNIRKPFTLLMNDREAYDQTDWTKWKEYPKPDFLSSRKRLIFQLVIKREFLDKWGKKLVVATDEPFFSNLPGMEEVHPSSADVAWLVYRMEWNASAKRYGLELSRTVYTDLRKSVETMTRFDIRDDCEFKGTLTKTLQQKIAIKLTGKIAKRQVTR